MFDFKQEVWKEFLRKEIESLIWDDCGQKLREQHWNQMKENEGSSTNSKR